MIRRLACWFVATGLLLSACSQATVVVTPMITLRGEITPYLSVTPSPTVPAPTLPVEIPVTPTPTATPFLYTVKGDDTMLGIAFRFGLTLEELQAANPTVDPHYMGEGLKLIIPIAQETPEALPTATPIPILVAQPQCYRVGDGGAWCITGVTNDLQASLENLSVWIGLYDPQGENFTSQTAYAPLNILRPGSTMPLMSYFAPPLPDQFQSQAKVISALTVAPDDKRYLDPQLMMSGVNISPSGLEARVSGEVSLPEGTTSLSQLWVLAVAYDERGNIIGERKWKSDGERTFEFSVYSLAGAIDHVEALVEARP